jgi:hypothetical protein
LENPGVNGRLILRRIFRKLNGGMGWIDLAQDSDRWRALVNAEPSEAWAGLIWLRTGTDGGNL